jgi:hypothetical protein
MIKVNDLGSKNTPFGKAQFFNIKGSYKGFNFTGLNWGVLENNRILVDERNELLSETSTIARFILELAEKNKAVAA